jgi:hypothetical protein
MILHAVRQKENLAPASGTQSWDNPSLTRIRLSRETTIEAGVVCALA